MNVFSSDPFSSQRGLRQGDPFSLYLFVICAEGFSALLQRVEENLNEISGIRVCRAAPKVSHLFFADDTLIFSKTRDMDYEGILNIIQNYGTTSGQQIKMEKSSLLFGPYVTQQVQEQIMDKFGIKLVMFSEKYLGLPSMVGRSKNFSFQTIKERVWKRIQSWKKLLSKRGKEIFIKAIAQAIPTYSMSYFLIPSTLCKELESLWAKFWLGGSIGC